MSNTHNEHEFIDDIKQSLKLCEDSKKHILLELQNCKQQLNNSQHSLTIPAPIEQKPIQIEQSLCISSDDKLCKQLVKFLRLILYDLVTLNMNYANTYSNFIIHGGRCIDFYVDNPSGNLLSFDYDFIHTQNINYVDHNINTVTSSLNAFCNRHYRYSIFTILKQYGFVSDSEKMFYETEPLFKYIHRNSALGVVVKSICISLKLTNDIRSHITPIDTDVVYLNIADFVNNDTTFIDYYDYHPTQHFLNHCTQNTKYINFKKSLFELNSYSMFDFGNNIIQSIPSNQKCIRKLNNIIDKSTKLYETFNSMTTEINSLVNAGKQTYSDKNHFENSLTQLFDNVSTLKQLDSFGSNQVNSSFLTNDFFEYTYGDSSNRKRTEKLAADANDANNTKPPVNKITDREVFKNELKNNTIGHNISLTLSYYTGSGHKSINDYLQQKQISQYSFNSDKHINFKHRGTKTLKSRIDDLLLLYSDVFSNYKSIVCNEIQDDFFYVYSAQAPFIYGNLCTMANDSFKLVYVPGNIIYVPHFFSTSFDPSVAFRFCRPHKVIFKIKIHKSNTNWFYLGKKSNVANEREILLKCNSFLIIDNVYKQLFPEHNTVKIIECSLKDTVDSAISYSSQLPTSHIKIFNSNASNIVTEHNSQIGGSYKVEYIPSIFFFPYKSDQLNSNYDIVSKYSEIYETYKNEINHVLSLDKNVLNTLIGLNIIGSIFEPERTISIPKMKTGFSHSEFPVVINDISHSQPISVMAGGKTKKNKKHCKN